LGNTKDGAIPGRAWGIVGEAVGFIIKSDVGVRSENHFGCVVGDTVVRIGGAVIEEVVDCLFCGFCGVGLASGDGVEGG